MFGPCAALTLRLDRPVTAVLAQDLAADAAVDITAQIAIDGTNVTVPGALLDRLCAGGDASEPGCVLLPR